MTKQQCLENPSEHTLELVRKIKHLAEQGLQTRHIAKEMGFSIAYIQLLKSAFELTKPQRRLRNKMGTADTLCYSCIHATNKYGACPWSKELKPVEGWNAVRRDIEHYNGSTESYLVIDCPNFVAG